MSKTDKDINFDNMQWLALKTFIDNINVTFAYETRFKIMKLLSESPKSFEELKTTLNVENAAMTIHIEALSKKAIIYITDNKLALTILGELIFNYFSKFLEEATKLEIMLKSDG